MFSNATNNKETVEVLINGELIQVNRKIIMKESKFFNRILSVHHSGAVSISVPGVTADTFTSMVKLFQKEENCITINNVNQISSLAKLMRCDFIKEKCAYFKAKMSDNDEVSVTLNILEKITQMREEARPKNLKEYLQRVFCGDFLVENRKRLRNISSEAKSLLLESVVGDLADLSAHMEWMEKETGRINKVEKKNSILEAQLMKALNDVRISQDQLKSTKDAHSELAKLKKKLAVSERKAKIQEEELENMRKKLASENKNNQFFQKKLEETQIDLEKEKKTFEDSIEKLRHSSNAEKEAVALEKLSLQKKLGNKLASANKKNKMFEKKLEETQINLKKERQSFEDHIEQLRESFNFDKESAANKQLELQKELSALKETVFQLQDENQSLRSSTIADIRPLDDLSEVEWNRLFNPSSVREEDCSNNFTTSTTFDWEQKPLWTNYDFLYL